jgi:hypothetical protein
MPTPEQILASLTTIANQWQMLAVTWHVFFAIFAITLVLGLYPSNRLAGILLGLPLISVCVLAWLYGNPFNGTLFALAAVALIVIAARLPAGKVQLARPWLLAAGILLFVFGWVYPHFLDTTSFVPYLYAAPAGLVPCPTLSMVIGLALVLDGLGSRTWSLVLGALGIFYGLFGAMRLGVTIDYVLLAGALLLVLVALLPHTTVGKQVLAH